MKQKVMLFAGTTEGRLLYEFLEAEGFKAMVFVTTAYGEQLLSHGKEETGGTARIHTGCLDREEMEEQMKAYAPALVIDATHPYASAATENIREASSRVHIPYIRVLRASCPAGDKNRETEKLTEAEDIGSAAAWLEHTEGNILVTTGSKELKELRTLTGFKDRVYARILPIPAMLEKCMELGLDGRHIICMQGPFSEEMNYAMLKEVDAAFLLTKESGAAGGFPEKLAAAQRAGAAVVVIKRPGQEEGYSVEQVKKILLAKDENSYG